MEKRLFKELLSYSDIDVVWRNSDMSFTASDLIKYRNSFQSNFPGLYRKKVAILGSKNLELAFVLLALDGFADSILLMPSEQDESALLDMFSRGKCTELISDRPLDGLAQIPMPSPWQFTDTKVNSCSLDFKLIDTLWVIPTSGTTGVPKLVAHKLSDLTEKTKNDKGKGQDVRWGLLYSLQRFAGLQVFFQAIFGGSQLLIADLSMPFEASLSFLRSAHCNALSATPTL